MMLAPSAQPLSCICKDRVELHLKGADAVHLQQRNRGYKANAVCTYPQVDHRRLVATCNPPSIRAQDNNQYRIAIDLSRPVSPPIALGSLTWMKIKSLLSFRIFGSSVRKRPLPSNHWQATSLELRSKSDNIDVCVSKHAF
jgi:hypothetical protein